MNARISLIAAAFALCAATDLTAQRPGTLEAGVFGNLEWIDNSNPVNDVTPGGVGARLGVFVLPNLELEVMGSWADSHLRTSELTDVDYIPLRALAVYHFGSGRIVPMIGAGWSHSRYTGAIDVQNNGAAGLVGFKAFANDWLLFRTEATLDAIPKPFDNSEQHLNWGVNAGFSVNLFSGRSRDVFADADRDGVQDMADRCAGTPSGERVDAVGCPTDADHDGVSDGMDTCPNTSAGAVVDDAGCAVDLDGDGVLNADDRCQDTPAGMRVDGEGCPRDFDHDGVTDTDDACPNTVAGAVVDSRGCPRDSDQDAVPDGLDQCPNTSADREVDARGCPILFEDDETALILEGVTFESGSATLTRQSRFILDQVAESLQANQDIQVEVGGHTDATGSRAYNLHLSQLRADAVTRYLGTKGVSPARLVSRGYGPDTPVASNDSASGRQENRRVELRRVN